MANRYPDIKLLAHKDVFASAMQFCSDVDDTAYNFVPPTFQFPSNKDMQRFQEYSKKHPNATFIAKPQVGAQGDSIVLFKQLRELPYALEGRDIVVQRYLDKPLLLDGIKFDLRVYVVVTGFNPIQAYICDEGLARFCTARYEAPTKSNYKKAFMHLTNYSINKTNEDYVHPGAEEILVENNATKRTLSSLYSTLRAAGIDDEEVKESIAYTCTKIMEMYCPLIEQQTTAMSNQLDVVGKPFQILGLDLLIDENLKAWVLEVNDHPSLNIYFDSTCGMEGFHPTDDDICEVDLFVKSRLVKDTITLCKKKRVDVLDIDEHGSLTKIHPPPNSDNNASVDMLELVQTLREVFYSLTPVKSKATVGAA